MSWLQCVRGGSGELPPVEVVSPAMFRAHVLEDSAAADSGTDSVAVESWNRGLAQLKLAPDVYDSEAQLDETLDAAAAGYFLRSRSVQVIDRGEPSNSAASVAVLAHELVHALQDQELGLEAYRERWATTFDRSLAVHALTEGEAVHYQMLAQLDQEESDPARVDWQRTYEGWRSDELREAEEDDAPLARARIRFPYAFGGGFVAQRWLIDGRAGIDALFESPPQSTREIMFGPAEEDLELVLTRVREKGAPLLGAGFERGAAGTLGAWIARMYAAKMRLWKDQRAPLAAAVAGDAFSVQRNPETGQLVSTWHLALLPPLWPAQWPGPDRLPRVRRWIPESERDVYLIASSQGVPPAPDTLEWTSIERDEASVEDTNMVSAPHESEHVLMCALSMPKLIRKPSGHP